MSSITITDLQKEASKLAKKKLDFVANFNAPENEQNEHLVHMDNYRELVQIAVKYRLQLNLLVDLDLLPSGELKEFRNMVKSVVSERGNINFFVNSSNELVLEVFQSI